MINHTRINNRIIWILAAIFLWGAYIDLATVAPWVKTLVGSLLASAPDAVAYTWENAGWRICTVAFFLLMCLAVKKNRFMLETLRPTRQKRSMSKMGSGMLIAFLGCMLVILCVMIHGDLRFYFDFSAAQIPLLLFEFVCVFFQCTAEELWFRTFLYERINVHYPLWVAIVINSLMFGAYHLMNGEGIPPLFVVNAIILGFVLSLLRWRTGSIWTCMGFHTMWNFTQIFIFNTMSVGSSDVGIFHAITTDVSKSLFYDSANGADGGFPSIFIVVIMCAMILMMAKKQGRLGELLESRESRGEISVELTRSRGQKAALATVILAFAGLMVLLVGSDILGLFYHPLWLDNILIAVAALSAIFVE